jgi:hypothetical protein
MSYAHRTTGRYRNGRRVIVFVRGGRWWLHAEVGPLAVGLMA